MTKTLGLVFAAAFVGCAHEPAIEDPATYDEGAVADPAAEEAELLERQEERWAAFERQHEVRLEQLGRPLLKCSRSRSAASCRLDGAPPFDVAHGLMALYGRTGDVRYRKAANQLLVQIKPNRLKWIAPRQAAWFLLLDVERERATKTRDLRSKARKVAHDLLKWIHDLEKSGITSAVLFGDANNLSWPLIALWRWAEHTEDAALQTKLREFVQRVLLDTEASTWCPMPVDKEPDPDELVAPCLASAAAVLEILGEDASSGALQRFVHDTERLDPLPSPVREEHRVLNFTRAADLFSLFHVGSSPAHRDLYVRHIEAQIQQLQELEAEENPIHPSVAAAGVHALLLFRPANEIALARNAR